MRHLKLLPTAAASLALLGAAVSPPAQAGVSVPEPISGLISPLSLAVDSDGTIYVSQNFIGVLTMKAPDGEPEDIYTDPAGSEVGAVSAAGGVVTFATTGATKDGRPTAKLKRWVDGDTQTVANLYKHEKSDNADGKTTYGVVGTSKSCQSKMKKRFRPYKGIVESHPYASALGEGVTYVADAAANAIWSVDDEGHVSTLATLPATKIALTKQVRSTLGLPGCSKEGTLKVEPVPTDVELAVDGNLYVTSLPGGPEDPSLGANGRVYRVNPSTGDVVKASEGLLSPTGLATTPTGTAYVSMLFAGQVLQRPLVGDPSTFANVPFPGDVEYAAGHVYVTRTDLTNEGETPPDGAVLDFDTTS